MKLAAVLLLLTGCGWGQYTIPHSTGALSVPFSGPLFSLSYPTLTISNCGSKNTMYTTDGSPATGAAIPYSAPITVSHGEVINAVCVTVGASQTQTQNSSTGTTCQTVPGGTYTGPPSITCSSSGGGIVGTPSNVIMNFPGGGSPATLEITAPASQSGETQALLKFLYGGSADPSAGTCDTCTTIVKDITFTVVGSGMDQQEHDSPWYNFTQGLQCQNGFQCKISTGLLEVDSGNADGWTATAASCSTWTAGTTHTVIESATDQWAATTCTGGNGCAHYDYVWADGTKTVLNGTYSNTQGCSTSTDRAYGWQFQPDLAPTGGSAVTAGWTVASATVALTMGDDSAISTFNVP